MADIRDDDSPVSMKSQISYRRLSGQGGSSVSDDGSSSLSSHAQFATQAVPFDTPSLLQPTIHRISPHRCLDETVSPRSIRESKSIDRPRGLLSQIEHEVKQAEPLGSAGRAPEPLAELRADVATGSSPCTQVTLRQCVANTPEKHDTDRSLLQHARPASPIAKCNAQKEILMERDHSINDSKHVQAMSPSMTHRFREWRAEAALGRYIPRYVCKIEKLQQKILDSEDGWQPPPVGRPTRPPTIPIAILSCLTEAADNGPRAITPEILSVPAQNQVSQRRRAEPGNARRRQGSLRPEDTTISSEHSNGKPEDVIKEADLSQEVGLSQWPASYPLASSPPEPPEQRLLPPDSSSSGEPESSLPTISAVPAPTNSKVAEHCVIVAAVAPQKALEEPVLATQGFCRTVQVKRTPYPIKELQNNSDPSSSLSLIPGTFDNLTCTASLPNKRKAEYVLPKSVKRPTADPDYADLDKRRIADRRTRRLALQNRARSRQQTAAPIPTISGIDNICVSSNGRGSSVSGSDLSSDLNTEETKASTHGFGAENTKTPPQVSPLEHLASRTGSTTSATMTRSADQVYARFKDAYPSYGGSRLHFRRACDMIQQLRKDNRAPHPYLWDDFVYRHYHEYRFYQQGVLSVEGHVLAYDSWYEQYVEEPERPFKIIKPGCLQDPSESPQPQHPKNVGLKDPSPATPVAVAKPIRDVKSSMARRTLPRLSSHDSNTGNKIDFKTSPFAEFHAMRDDVDIMDQISQQSSVHSWLEKAAGAESPELGTDPGKNAVDVETLSLDTLACPSMARKNISDQEPVNDSAHGATPRSQLWLDQNAPFKAWARQYDELPGEADQYTVSPAKRAFKRPYPINIFTWSI